jgi:stearoyl-CoA desaturase (delta-9 desaturase)
MKPEAFEYNPLHHTKDNVQAVSKEKSIDWTNTLFLTITPILAIVLSIIFFNKNGFNFTQVFMAVIFYFVTGMSITGGYHRLFSHRTYEANKFVKLFYLLFGAAAFQNSALKWSADHRIHHNHVDEEKDPYNINKGFFYAHIGWIFFKETNADPKFPKDLLKDGLVVWQHKYYFPIAVMMGLVLPTFLGHLLGSALGGLALSGLARIVFVHHCTFFINSLCHIVGTRPYTDSNTARDSAIMAFFSYGEGYHNYHHYFPTDYRNGIKWYQFDPTKWLIKVLAVIGFAKNLKKVPERLIIEAQLKMKHSF